MDKKTNCKESNFFHSMGVYGFNEVEPLILAALISEDPLLLIGKAGTGKTFLLNSISEAMGLNHRHYNASLISFDDLVGFPYPSADGKSISFLPTPATIWDAESVLVDELSRCKPEVQNKFFSVIHERKLQGMDLTHLKYRWAAMNPFAFDVTNEEDSYQGSIPLDQALADRFAFIIEVPDWIQLTTKEQEAVIYPAGEGAKSEYNSSLKEFVNKMKPLFTQSIIHPIPEVVTYARLASTMLTEAGFRISPRRARLLARNLTAVSCVSYANGNNGNVKNRKALYKLTLKWSLPHRAWKTDVPGHIIDSVHAEVSRLVFEANTDERWISELLLKPSLADKVDHLFDEGADTDTKSLGVLQLLARESKTRAGIFSMCLFPLLSEQLIIHEEALNEVAKVATRILSIDGQLEWRENYHEANTQHPNWSECLHFLNNLPSSETGRIKRARQFFLYLIINKEVIHEPEMIEKELNECFQQTKKYAVQIMN